jgi:hypothetical protein
MSEPLRLTVGAHDILERDYHLDPAMEPSLSNSIARVIWDSCPLKAWLDHPRCNPNYVPSVPTKDMEFGTLVHKLMLEKGAEVDICTADDWKTKFAQEFRKDSRESGHLPVLQHIYDDGLKCKAGALRELTRLGILADFNAGVSERTYIWREDQCYLRTMIDKVLVDDTTCTINVMDLKVTGDASPEACYKKISEMSYDIQEHMQIRALQNIYPHLAGRIKHMFIFIEREFPYLCTPVELTAVGKHNGAGKFGYTFGLWKKAMATGKWPGYTSGIVAWEPKPWDTKRVEEALGLA